MSGSKEKRKFQPCSEFSTPAAEYAAMPASDHRLKTRTRSDNAAAVEDQHGGREDRLRTRIAWYYYIEGLTQTEIADLLDINRVRVNRLLASCRESGVVQIQINSSLAPCIALERQLEKTWQLARAIVVPSPADPGKISESIAAAAGSYLSEHLASRLSLGLGWGKILRLCLRYIQSRRIDDLTMISLLGGLTRASEISSHETALRLASLTGGDCLQVPAPILTKDETVCRLMMEQQGYRELLESAKSLNSALISASSLEADSNFGQLDLLTATELEELRNAGAVGELLGYHIDIDGSILDHPINRRVVAIGLDLLKQIPSVVLAAGGDREAAVIRGALAGGYVGVLITDEATATVLANDEPGQLASRTRNTSRRAIHPAS